MSKKTPSIEELISQKEAAAIRGVSKQAIASLVRRGRLTVVEVAGKSLLIRKEVEEFVARPVGRPRKKAAGAGSLELGAGKKG